MSIERSNALGKYELLKKEVYALGIRAASHLNDLQNEIDTLTTDKDFSQIDLDAVQVLIDALKGIQNSFNEKRDKMNKLAETYGF